MESEEREREREIENIPSLINNKNKIYVLLPYAFNQVKDMLFSFNRWIDRLAQTHTNEISHHQTITNKRNIRLNF